MKTEKSTFPSPTFIFYNGNNNNDNNTDSNGNNSSNNNNNINMYNNKYKLYMQKKIKEKAVVNQSIRTLVVYSLAKQSFLLLFAAAVAAAAFS